VETARRSTLKRLRNQLCTTLGATTSEHKATALGGHAGAETMGALAAQAVRLEGTFHDTGLVSGRGVYRDLRETGKQGVHDRAVDKPGFAGIDWPAVPNSNRRC